MQKKWEDLPKKLLLQFDVCFLIKHFLFVCVVINLHLNSIKMKTTPKNDDELYGRGCVDGLVPRKKMMPLTTSDEVILKY